MASQPKRARRHATDSESRPLIVKYFNEDVKTRKILGQLKGKGTCLLQLRSCRLEREIWSELAKDTKGSKVSRLYLDYTNLNGKVKGLAECVAYRGVEELSLIFTKMQNEDLELFREELEEAKKGRAIQLHSLRLMHVDLDKKGCAILAQIVNLLPNVQKLDITNCDLTDESVGKFSESISTGKSIKRLYLAKNENIKKDGMAEVGKLSKKCKTKKLDVSFCELTDSRLEKLTENQYTITNLVLKGNVDLSNGGLCHNLSEWKSLRKVDVRKCWLVQKDVEALEAKLGDDCKINHDVQFAEITSASGKSKEPAKVREKAADPSLLSDDVERKRQKRKRMIK